MKTRVLGITVAAWLAAVTQPGPAQSAGIPPDLRPLLSQLQSMGEGRHTDAEWQAVEKQIQAQVDQAAQAGDWPVYVEINLVRAMACNDMRNDPERALKILDETAAVAGKKLPKDMPRIYARKAEALARMGDPAAIDRLIAEFRQGPYYNPDDHGFSGGEGRKVPLTVLRPGKRGDASITVTTMEKFRRQAEFGRGKPFPAFSGKTLDGKALSLSDLKGRVVLVDFWTRGTYLLGSQLRDMQALDRQFAPKGLAIVGVNIEMDRQNLAQFIGNMNMSWPQLAANRDLARTLSLYGEAANYLVDGSGQILARNLKGDALVRAVDKAVAGK